MKAVAPRHLRKRELLLEVHGLRVEPLGIELDHEQQRQVVEAGRDDRHPDHVEVADLEELGDQEGGGAQHRRRDDGAEPAGGEQTAGRVLLESRPLHQRIGHGADRHRGGDAGAGRTAEQKRGQHHRAAGAVGLVAHQRHGKIDEEFSGAGMLQERAIDREQDDERGRHVHRNAENALQRDEEMADELRNVIAAVRPRRRQIWPVISVGHERDRHARDDPAGGSPRRLEQQHDEHDAEHDVEMGRHGGAVGEFLAAFYGVDQDRRAGDTGDNVPPADVVAKSRRHRKQQEAQHHHEGDVGVAQRLGGDDGKVGERPGARDRGVEVKQRHRHRDRRDQRAGPADEAIDHAVLGLDIGLGLAQPVFRNALGGWLSLGHVLGHVPPCPRLWVRLRRRDKARSPREKPEVFDAARGQVD